MIQLSYRLGFAKTEKTESEDESEPMQCAICQLGETEDSALTAMLCGHSFHQQCLSAYSDSMGVRVADLNCPTCKPTSGGRMVANVAPSSHAATNDQDTLVATNSQVEFQNFVNNHNVHSDCEQRSSLFHQWYPCDLYYMTLDVICKLIWLVLKL